MTTSAHEAVIALQAANETQRLVTSRIAQARASLTAMGEAIQDITEELRSSAAEHHLPSSDSDTPPEYEFESTDSAPEPDTIPAQDLIETMPAASTIPSTSASEPATMTSATRTEQAGEWTRVSRRRREGRASNPPSTWFEWGSSEDSTSPGGTRSRHSQHHRQPQSGPYTRAARAAQVPSRNLNDMIELDIYVLWIRAPGMIERSISTYILPPWMSTGSAARAAFRLSLIHI